MAIFFTLFDINYPINSDTYKLPSSTQSVPSANSRLMKKGSKPLRLNTMERFLMAGFRGNLTGAHH